MIYPSRCFIELRLHACLGFSGRRLSRSRRALHENILPARRVFPGTGTGLPCCFWLWTSYLGMASTPTYQKHNISRHKYPYLLVTQSYNFGRRWSFWRLAPGAWQSTREIRRILTLPPVDCLPKNIAWCSRGLYRHLYCRHSAYHARQRILLSCSMHTIIYFVISYLIVHWKMLLSLTSMFNALALSRSLSNSLETSLTTIAFAFYPWDASDKLSPHVLFNRYIQISCTQLLVISCSQSRPKLRKFIAFSALACMIRPTNVIIWIYLYANLIFAVRKYPKVACAIILDTLAIG